MLGSPKSILNANKFHRNYFRLVDPELLSELRDAHTRSTSGTV